jgi:excinuclease ABC subunit A
MSSAIAFRGVRVHNLKGIDVSIPTEKLVVITGVSGSGKSSLAFDTVYAEGRRRYVESLSTYARQFLERIEKPDLDGVDGICPAIAIRQRTPSSNPRSTVATATEILDHLRLLFARVGRGFCDSCGSEVGRDTAESVADRVLGLPPGTAALVGFPLSAGGTPRADLFEGLLKRGFGRLLAGERVLSLEAETEEAAALPDDPLVVLVDRITVGEGARSRVVDAVETAFGEGGGQAMVQVRGGPRLRFSEAHECSRCARAFPEPQPRLFSFNSPFGACPACHGFGNVLEIALDRVVPDPGKSLAGGAIEPWNRPRYRAYQADLRRFAQRHGIPRERPWSELHEAQRRAVLEGDAEFPGVFGFFRVLEGRKYKVQVRAFLGRYRDHRECAACGGSRLRPEALRVRVGGRGIHEVLGLSVRQARAFLSELVLDEPDRKIAQRIRADIDRRLSFLAEVGLDYLTLDRPFGTLSGGEAQRIAIASALGTGLVGTAYVLDEPSVGLHPRDTDRLVGTLKALRDQGHTVLVVEHDPGIMREADHIIDLGPGAGDQGGRVVFQGSYPELLADGRSLTGKYLRGDLAVPSPAGRKRRGGPALVVRGARVHNLQGVDVRIPLGALTCVTGVSGSGKSSLVHDVLCAAFLRRPGGREKAVGYDAIEGLELLEGLELVDQAPIGRSPRSNAVTYLKAFDAIRELFAATADARRLGLRPGDFSFNLPGGRCEACAGEGRVRVDMQFLADAYLACEGCGGRRYGAPVLEVRYRGKSIDQILDLTVREAVHFFAGQTRVVRPLRVFEQIGLGYLRLGQPAGTLSGGEAQRVKLAAHLMRKAGRRVLYVLDEPTTGLHMSDVADLLACLERLLEQGATLLVIEHNLDVIRRSDWVIDLGPEGGARGGRLVFQGTPEELARTDGATARYLRGASAGSHRSGVNLV